MRDYGVYVIEINEDPMYVYVGYTSKQFSERLKQHNSGLSKNKAARIFINGARGTLRKDLYEGLPRFDLQEDAEAYEEKIALDLLNKGYSVECDKLPRQKRGIR